MTTIQLVECPRDAMQGWAHPIPTDQKIAYHQLLLQVGFHTLDFGSFVSPKAIPQMADTHEVIRALDLSETSTKLLAIIANERGADDALVYPDIAYLGFPFSVSPTFQQRNTQTTMEESFDRVKSIQEKCVRTNRQLVIYLSMGFGNPYGDPYDETIIAAWTERMKSIGIPIISVADTVGMATPEQITRIMQPLITSFSDMEIGVHLHAAPDQWKSKLDAALEAGVTRIDGALKGIGGCPMAKDDLVGNMDTERMIPYLQQMNRLPVLNEDALQAAQRMAQTIFVG